MDGGIIIPSKEKTNQSTKDIKYQKGFGDSSGKVEFHSSI